MATTFPGLGPADLVPLANRDLDPAAMGLGRDEYYVLTRVDGRTSLRDLLLISGFPEAQGLEILRRLRAAGAIYFDGETPPKPAPLSAIPPPEAVPEPVPEPVVLDATLLAEDVELADDLKRMILLKHASLGRASYFAILGVPRDAGRNVLKLAYRKLSKDFHPDRPQFFGKRLGSYQTLLGEIFAVASTAYEVLMDEQRRAEYVASIADRPRTTPLSGSLPLPVETPASGTRLPTPAQIREFARLRFEEACHHQVSGELDKALPEFASAIAMDPQPRYLRRAAEAALKAQELRVAEEYGKKAAELDPHNASAHRILAKVLRALGRLPEARRALELASKLDPQNPHVAAELQSIIEAGG